jgi:uncharacterized protein with PQ loop repeat
LSISSRSFQVWSAKTREALQPISHRTRHYHATPTNPNQVPQLLENYKQGSADGISLAFLTVWFIGDITNLAGALWAGLVPTVIALAIYFCFADLILISQCVYYNLKNARRERKASARSTESVEAPLLGRRDSSNLGLPGSHRRDSQASRRRRASSLPTIADVEEGGGEWIKNSLSYASAVCYLGARIPQIIKNQRDKSCEGLSLLFFMLSLLGNATYGAGVSVEIREFIDGMCWLWQILFHSQEKEYLLTNLPWLIGSLGTMVEDAIIFVQFRAFGSAEQTSALEA